MIKFELKYKKMRIFNGNSLLSVWSLKLFLRNWELYFINFIILKGKDDSFMEELQPERLIWAVKDVSSLQVSMRMQEGYDHSYYFIATFMEDHIKHHVKYLKN